MGLPLLEEGSNVLTWPSEPWDFDRDGDPSDLVDSLFQTLTENGGVGLAAPQCGIHRNIFVMGNFTKLVACINPMVMSVSPDTETDVEGCLSFPDLWLKVQRPSSCVVRYQHVDGEWIEEELTGLMSRVFLHEFDHLMGVTFDNRVGNLSLKMAKEKRKKQQKKLARATA